MTEYATRAYKFAVHGDLPPAAIEEIRRAHNLRNKLVEIEHRHEERVAAVWAAEPELVELTDQVAAAEFDLEELRAEAAGSRRSSGQRKVPAELRDRTKGLRDELRALKAHLRERKDAKFPAMRAAFAEAGDQRQAEIKATYDEWARLGLYWATWNEVAARHKTAVKAMNQKRKAGQVAQLKFHRWTGEGTIAIQLQQGAGSPSPTPDLIADLWSSPWRNVAVLTPAHDPVRFATLTRGEQRREARGKLRFRIGSDVKRVDPDTGELIEPAAALIEVPVIVHRPIPPDGEVKMILVTRRLIAGKARVTFSVVVRTRPPRVRATGRTVAVHLGWRSLGDGSIRVAVVAGAGLPPAELVRAGVVHLAGSFTEVTFPVELSNLMAIIPKAQSRRDLHLDAMRDVLRDWLITHVPISQGSPVEGITPGDVAKWRSPARFVNLLRDWRENPPPYDDASEIIEALEYWARRDSWRWTHVANQRDQNTARRNDYWAKVAAWICADARTVVVDGWNAARMAQKPVIEDEDTHQARAARVHQRMVSPAHLREVIESTARRDGVTVEALNEEIATTHHGCGGILDAEDRRDSMVVVCRRCGRHVDQDESTLGNMLEVVRRSAGAEA